MMCGRFALRTSGKALADFFGLTGEPAVEPRYNIAPSQPVAVVRTAAAGAGRELAWLRWGLIPPWAQDPALGNQMVNARVESAATRPAFRGAFRHRRCLVPADGFYEWQRTNGNKQPYYVTRLDGRPLAFAGLWEVWDRGGGPIESCTILTTAADDRLAALHDRMPVLLEPEAYARWLDPAVQDPAQLQRLLRPYPSEALALRRVGPQVNDPRNDGPRCIEPQSDMPLFEGGPA
jgi:putative SOS response-associated peptidase YedK